MPQATVSHVGMLHVAAGDFLPSQPMMAPPMISSRRSSCPHVLSREVMLLERASPTRRNHGPEPELRVDPGQRQLRKPTWPATPPPIST